MKQKCCILIVRAANGKRMIFLITKHRDVLEALIATKNIRHIHILQFGTHKAIYHPEAIRVRFCRIREHLSKTHDMDPESMPWAWERWVRKIK